jgi:hypothetical protein
MINMLMLMQLFSRVCNLFRHCSSVSVIKYVVTGEWKYSYWFNNEPYFMFCMLLIHLDIVVDYNSILFHVSVESDVLVLKNLSGQCVLFW